MIFLRKQTVLRLLYFFVISCAVTYIVFFTVSYVSSLTENDTHFYRFATRLSLSLVLMTLFFAWISCKGYLFRFLINFFVFLIPATAWYIGFKYSVECNAVFFADVLTTTAQEAAPFFSYHVLVFYASYILFCLLLSFVTGLKPLDVFPVKTRKQRFLCNFLAFVFLLLSFNFYFYPVRTCYRAVRYLSHAYEETADFMKYTRILEKHPPVSVIQGKHDDEILFLHIGESVRSDHASINGYERNTTPGLLKEQKEGRLFSFKNTISYGAVTRFSVSGMLTDATVADPVIKNAGLVSLLSAASVNSAVFFSSLSDPGEMKDRHQIVMNFYTASADKIIFCPETAHSVLPEIKEHTSASKGLSFVLYSGEGSHLPYDRYDKDRFSVFMPVNFQKNNDETTTNAYDNTIVCTDDFICSVLEMLKDKKAVYFYVSDHGEVMGENGKWGRSGHNPMWDPVMRKVLCFIWVSDRFRKEEPEKFAALQRNVKLSAVSHDHIYHTVMGFYNIKNDIYDSRLDLFSPDAEPFTGPFPEDLPYGSTVTDFKFDISGK